jgi:hypothetical protein
MQFPKNAARERMIIEGRSKRVEIVGSPEVVNVIQSSESAEDINSLIEKAVTVFQSVDKVFIHRLVPGRSQAVVFLGVTHSFGTPDIPFVIKCGPYELLSKEAENYDTYVWRKLRTAPHLLPSRPVINGKMAIIYELAGWTKDPGDIITYREYFHKEEPDSLVCSMVTLLADLESWWNSANVAERYILDYLKFYSEPSLSNSLMEASNHEFARYLSGDPLQLIDFWSYWKNHWPFKTTMKSIVHGDLNSTNILMDTRNGVGAIIDFASIRSDGHILSDIAKIEREIRCRLMGAELIQFEEHLEEQEELELFFYCLGVGTLSSHRFIKESKGYWRAYNALLNIYNKAYRYLMNFYQNETQFLAEFYVSLFFQTILVTMFEKEDYLGQRIAAINSCFRLKNYIENILGGTSLPLQRGEPASP